MRLPCYASQITKEGIHGADITDVGDVVQVQRLVGQQAGRHQGQGDILVPSGGDSAPEPTPALDVEVVHGVPVSLPPATRQGGWITNVARRRPGSTAWMPVVSEPPPVSLLGKGVNLLAQGVELSLHDGEALALRHFLGLGRAVVGGKRGGLLGQGIDLLRQVG